VRLVGELPQQGVAAVDEGYLARHCQPSRLMKRQHKLGQRAGGLHPGRPAPHDDDVDRTGLAGRRIVYRGKKQFLQMQPQAFGVSHGIQRKGVL
jgi:hypothetical protein